MSTRTTSDGVPSWPTLEIVRDAAGHASINGRPIPADTRAAVLAEATRFAATTGRPLRVRAHDPHGVWHLIAHPNGNITPITPTRRAGRRTLLAAVAVLAITAAAIGTRHATSSGPPPAIATPTPSAVALPAPPGFSRSPDWEVPVLARPAPVVAADGTILALTPDHTLALLDPATGRRRWSIPLPAGTVTELHLTRIDGHPAAALTVGAVLTYVVLPIPGQGGLQPVTVNAAAGSVWSWTSMPPLLTMPGGTAVIVHARTAQTVRVPSGTTAITVDGADVIAVDRLGRWWRLTPGKMPGKPQVVPKPKNATAVPIRVIAVGPGHLAMLWATNHTQTLTLYAAHTGKVSAQLVLPATTITARSPVITQPGTPRLTLGPVLIDPTTKTLRLLGAGYTVRALTGGHLYAGDTTGRTHDLPLTPAGTRPPVLLDGDAAAIPLGIITPGRDHALLLDTTGAQPQLYALPAI